MLETVGIKDWGIKTGSVLSNVGRSSISSTTICESNNDDSETSAVLGALLAFYSGCQFHHNFIWMKSLTSMFALSAGCLLVSLHNNLSCFFLMEAA